MTPDDMPRRVLGLALSIETFAAAIGHRHTPRKPAMAHDLLTRSTMV